METKERFHPLSSVRACDEAVEGSRWIQLGGLTHRIHERLRNGTARREVSAHTEYGGDRIPSREKASGRGRAMITSRRPEALGTGEQEMVWTKGRCIISAALGEP